MKRKSCCVRNMLSAVMALSLIMTLLIPSVTVGAVTVKNIFSPTVDTFLSNWVSEQNPQVLSVKDRMSVGYTDKYWATGGCYDEANVLDITQASVDLKRYGFLKFDLSMVNRPIVSAKFVFTYRDNNNTNVSMTLNFKKVVGEWDATLNWANRPQKTDVFAQTNVVSTKTGAWITAGSVDMTDFVKECLAQEGKNVNFAIDNISWAGTLDIASQEHATTSCRPQLVLTYADETVCDTAINYASDSAYISTNTADACAIDATTYVLRTGKQYYSTGLVLSESTPGFLASCSYLKFNLSELASRGDDILGAALVFNYKNRSAATKLDMMLYNLDDGYDSWSNGMKWDDGIVPRFLNVTNSGATSSSYYYDTNYFARVQRNDMTANGEYLAEVDVTSQVLSELNTGNENLSIGIANDNSSGHLGIISHLNTAGLAPRLVVFFAKNDMEITPATITNTGNTYTAEAVVSNFLDKTLTATIVIATYETLNGGKKLVDCSMESYTIDAYTASKKLSISQSGVTVGFEVKAFLLNSLDNLTPLEATTSVIAQ